MKLELYARTNANGHALVISGDVAAPVPRAFRSRDARGPQIEDRELSLNPEQRAAIAEHLAAIMATLVYATRTRTV